MMALRMNHPRASGLSDVRLGQRFHSYATDRVRADLSSDEESVRRGKLCCRNLSVLYGDIPVIQGIDLEILEREVIALIGPSGAGKSTLLRCFNRMNDVVPGCRVSGIVTLNGRNIYDSGYDPVESRIMVGMVFSRPNPYPKSIYENVAYGLRIHGRTSSRIEEFSIVERHLRAVGLWSEVESRLGKSALTLSHGQQQRLCIARALAINPEIVLMDEPCSSLDPVATAEIEGLLEELATSCSVVLVTQSLQQAARVSKKTAFIHQGVLIEVGSTAQIFTAPRHILTERYITGRSDSRERSVRR